MCDKCNEARTEAGIAALEAVANGEEVPPMPEPSGIPDGAIPIPMVVEENGDMVRIHTTKEGWIALKVLMSIVGGLSGPDL